MSFVYIAIVFVPPIRSTPISEIVFSPDSQLEDPHVAKGDTVITLLRYVMFIAWTSHVLWVSYVSFMG